MSFSQEDMDILKENGFNAIRLGVMWSGAQPYKDFYNQTYFKNMVQIVNKAGKQGIYTLVEFHQDILAQAYCGDGVPTWIIHQIDGYKTFPFPLDKKFPINQSKVPDKLHCHKHAQASYYFAYDTAKSFDKLYCSKSYLNKKFTQFWQKVAQYFKDNEYVIAYELINQPWVGNLYRNPSLLIPSVAQRVKLQGFYDQLSMSIRKVDPNTPICFQPITFDNFVRSGFRHPPGGSRYQNQSIFCYHYYSPPEVNVKTMQTNIKNGQRLNVPSMLTQTYGNQSTLNKAQQFQQSWMYWIYKDFGQDDKFYKGDKDLSVTLKDRLDSDFKDYWIRTYMPKVAGQLIWSNYNQTTAQYIASYWATPNSQSILYLNKQRNYKNSYEISSIPKNNVVITQSTQAKQKNYVKVKFTGKEKTRIILSVIKL